MSTRGTGAALLPMTAIVLILLGAMVVKAFPAGLDGPAHRRPDPLDELDRALRTEIGGALRTFRCAPGEPPRMICLTPRRRR